MNEFDYFIDSNIFLRTLIKENEEVFCACFDFLEFIKQGKIKAYTSVLVLSEVGWTLSSFYKLPKEKVIESLHSILSLPNLVFQEEFNPSLALKFFEEYSVKLIDAFIASISKVQNKEMIVVSYDKDFDKLDIVRKEPKTIIKSLKPLKKKKN